MSTQPDTKASHQPEIHRLLPQAGDAERGTLCSILMAPGEVLPICREKGVTPEWFHLPANALIYREMVGMDDDRRPIDLILLTQSLRDRNALDQAGGSAYVTEIATFQGTYLYARNYLDDLNGKRMLREIIKTCTEYASRSYEEQHDPGGMLDGLERQVLAIRQSLVGEIEERETKELVMEVIHDIEERYERRGALAGLGTGFAELDQMTDGLRPNDLIVIAARPSMGKSALGLDIALHAVLTEKKTAAVMTLEMGAKQLVQRALLSNAHVNLHNVNRGFLSDGDFPKLTAAAGKIAGSKLKVLDCNGATIQAVRAKGRRLKRRCPDLAIIVIDYLQLMRSNSPQAKNSREREVAEISSGCKEMAKELGIPVVVLAQLNREVEKRKGDSLGRPRLSDLRESGSIEQDADVIGLLYRDEYYAENEEAKREVEGRATLIVAKNRNGPVGDVPLTFLKEFTTFENRAREVDPEPRNYHP